MIGRLQPGSLFSEATFFNSVLSVSGQVAIDHRSEQIERQTKEVLERIERLLEEGNSARDLLLSASVFLTSRELIDGFNTVWAEWLPRNAAPARTTIVCELLAPDFLVEVSVVAAIRS